MLRGLCEIEAQDLANICLHQSRVLCELVEQETNGVKTATLCRKKPIDFVFIIV